MIKFTEARKLYPGLVTTAYEGFRWDIWDRLPTVVNIGSPVVNDPSLAIFAQPEYTRRLFLLPNLKLLNEVYFTDDGKYLLLATHEKHRGKHDDYIVIRRIDIGIMLANGLKVRVESGKWNCNIRNISIEFDEELDNYMVSFKTGTVGFVQIGETTRGINDKRNE